MAYAQYYQLIYKRFSVMCRVFYFVSLLCVPCKLGFLYLFNRFILVLNIEMFLKNFKINYCSFVHMLSWQILLNVMCFTICIVSFLSTEMFSWLWGCLIKIETSFHSELCEKVRSDLCMNEVSPFQRVGPVTSNAWDWMRAMCDLEIWASLQSLEWNRQCVMEKGIMKSLIL